MQQLVAPSVPSRYLFCPWEQLCTSRLAKTDINNSSPSVFGASLRAVTGGKGGFVSALILYQPILNQISRAAASPPCSEDKAEGQRLPWVLALREGRGVRLQPPLAQLG